jgi:PmbA protein
MNTSEKYTLANLIVEHANKGGAEQVSVVISENRSTSIEIRDQKIDSLKESNQNSLRISLFVDKKYSSHSTNRLKEDELKKFVDEAINATRFLAEDELRALPDPELYYKGGGADLNTFDTKLDSVDPKAKIDLANQALNEAYKKDERIISVSSYYSDTISNMVIVKSNGFKGNSANSDVSLSVSVSLKSDSGRPSDYWYENSLFFDKLKTTEIGKKALERTINKIDPKKIESGKYQVIIENRVAGNICNPVFQALQGSNLYKKQSFLIGKENKLVASPLLTLTDDPLIPSAPGSRLFDGEGLAAVQRTIIEKGVLKNYFIDNYYGKKLGMKPTSGSSSNIIFSNGTRGKDEMIKSMKKGVVAEGKIVQPVNEMNITGNMNKFWFNLAELGNDVFPNQSLRIPSIMFNDIELSGL